MTDIKRSAQEANFDGLVGPTHNYAGLAFGNVASASNADKPSNPRAAARQGLDKMKRLADLNHHIIHDVHDIIYGTEPAGLQ